MAPAMTAGNPTFCGSCGKPLDPSAQFSAAKRAFLRAYNRNRTSAGLAPVSTAKLF